MSKVFYILQIKLQIKNVEIQINNEKNNLSKIL